jgi:hypothetical protein
MYLGNSDDSEEIAPRFARRPSQAQSECDGNRDQDLMWDLAKKSPAEFAKQMFDELFEDFVKETNFRGAPENAREQFEAWLKKPKN